MKMIKGSWPMAVLVEGQLYVNEQKFADFGDFIILHGAFADMDA
jgi:hypothetical protein